MTNHPTIARRPDDRGLLIRSLLEANDRLMRENDDLRIDVRALRETLQASCDLNHRLSSECRKLRAYSQQLREQSPARRAA